jgi:putative FmdB family regulatory protein
MPIYEYGCQACGEKLEAQQKLADPPLTTCPACGQPRLEKLISLTSFQLKGGGWYKDLYSSPKEKGSEKPANDRADKTTGGENEKKPDSASSTSSPSSSPSSSSSSSSTPPSSAAA